MYMKANRKRALVHGRCLCALLKYGIFNKLTKGKALRKHNLKITICMSVCKYVSIMVLSLGHISQRYNHL